MSEAPASIPWYQSNVLRGLAVSVISQAVVILRTHGVIDPDADPDVAMLVDLIFQLAALGAAAYAGWSRLRQPTPPITLTKQPPETP